MKRSEINKYIKHAVEFIQSHGWVLPPFAHWTPRQWGEAGSEADEARACRLGWDVTDFDAGRFEQFGNLLFTVRNGLPSGQAKPYAEKVMVVREGQHVPLHFHFKKTEDIINRGRGILVLEMFHSTMDHGKADDAVTVWCDGFRRTVPGGGQVTLNPGESITLPPRMYHRFWAAPGTGTLFVGEVSSVNDDTKDNHHLDPLPRFCTIEEDEPPEQLLCGEYPPASA